MLSACSHAKNILRIYEADIYQKFKRILTQSQIRHQSLETPVGPFFSNFMQKKNYFKNILILFRYKGVVTLLHMHFKKLTKLNSTTLATCSSKQRIFFTLFLYQSFYFLQLHFEFES